MRGFLDIIQDESELKGRLEGKLEAKLENAKAMLLEGLRVDVIVRITKFSVEQIESILKEIKVEKQI